MLFSSAFLTVKRSSGSMTDTFFRWLFVLAFRSVLPFIMNGLPSITHESQFIQDIAPNTAVEFSVRSIQSVCTRGGASEATDLG